MLRLIIYGAPRTKKTSNRIVRIGKGPRSFTKILPSKAHEEWFYKALPQAVSARNRTFATDVRVTALIYRESYAGDLVGYLQAIGDLLERSGILENDRLITSWDGSRLLKDSAVPRVEIEITEISGAQLGLEVSV